MLFPTGFYRYPSKVLTLIDKNFKIKSNNGASTFNIKLTGQKPGSQLEISK
jgi:hypothetical protein